MLLLCVQKPVLNLCSSMYCSYKVAVCQAAVCRIGEYMWICGILLLSGEDQWLAMTGLS